MFCRYRLLADNRQLEINSAEVSADTARFTCIAMSEAGVADRDFDLDVLGKQYMSHIVQKHACRKIFVVFIPLKRRIGGWGPANPSFEASFEVRVLLEKDIYRQDPTVPLLNI